MTAPRVLRATVDGVTYRVQVDPKGRLEMTAEAETTPSIRRVESLDATRVRVVEGDTRRTVAEVVSNGNAFMVSIGGEAFEIEVEGADQPAARRRSRGGSEGLAAPMPATVVRVLVSPGDAVTGGQTLVLLEAMKMELPIRAPRDGIVAVVGCNAGDLVQAGLPLIELAPA